jgi:mitochondrial fission protein ELM1
VLNDVHCGAAALRAQTLILIGGPSRHHGWDELALLDQVARVLAGTRGPVVISDSRRTPHATRVALATLARPGVTFEASARGDPGWLPHALCAATAVWVTADSVSMLFEALTAGAGVGLLDVPVRRFARIARIAPMLVAEGLVTPLAAWRPGAPLRAIEPLAEAARCAALILARWPGIARHA